MLFSHRRWRFLPAVTHTHKPGCWINAHFGQFGVTQQFKLRNCSMSKLRPRRGINKSLLKQNFPVFHQQQVNQRDILFAAAPSLALFSHVVRLFRPPPAQLARPPFAPEWLRRRITYSRPSVFLGRRHYCEANTPVFGCGWLLTCSAGAWTCSRGTNTNKCTIKFKADGIHCKINKYIGNMFYWREKVTVLNK